LKKPETGLHTPQQNRSLAKLLHQTLALTLSPQSNLHIHVLDLDGDPKKGSAEQCD
jgi:hypothetical protein